MAFCYDGFSNFKPGQGNVAVSDGSWQAVTFVATGAAAVAYSAVSWLVEESNDGTVWTTADPTEVLTGKPKDLTLTEKAFHCSYVGKKVYARATHTGLAGPVYTLIYSRPAFAPIFADSISGVEDGNWTTNPPS